MSDDFDVAAGGTHLYANDGDEYCVWNGEHWVRVGTGEIVGDMPAEGQGNWLSRFYYWFWHDLLHLPKPITHICRDTYHDLPLLTLLVWSIGFYAIGKYIGTQDAIFYALAVGFGIVLGHFFWAGANRKL